jgi:hypothetical protein
MCTPAFLRALVELAACDSLDALLDATLALLERELGVRAWIELRQHDGRQIIRGHARAAATHRMWIGVHYTLGAIYVDEPDVDAEPIELLARQLAPLAERLLDIESSQSRTIREDVDLLYERRIREALVRRDWNASAVARELAVSRSRVAEVVRRWKCNGIGFELRRGDGTS